MNQKTATIPVDVLNQVLSVLSGLPYSQVADIIRLVQQTVEINDDQPTETPAAE